MHDEKIWGIDVANDKYILTGGGDSTLKLWQDCTIEKEQEDKEKELQRLQDEQRLSALIRDEDFIEAAVMAFKLNKLRDFYLIVNKVLQNKTAKVDPVDSVLQDRQRFKSFIDAASLSGDIRKAVIPQNDTSSVISKIVIELLKDSNKKRLIEILRNMNSKHEFA